MHIIVGLIVYIEVLLVEHIIMLLLFFILINIYIYKFCDDSLLFWLFWNGKEQQS